MATKNPQPTTSSSEWTVLVVDDNPDEVEITGRALSKIRQDLKVQAISTGEAALERLRTMEKLPSVVVLDLKMPGMSGFDVLRRMRSDERLKDIHVIVVTNSALESDRKESYAAGADFFLQKAFDLNQFSREMKPLLDRLLKT
jgi:two-component system response regulator